MIVCRNVITAKRGHAAEIVALAKTFPRNSQVKSYRILQNYIGKNQVVMIESELESVAEWESWYNEGVASFDFSRWYEITSEVTIDFWTVEHDG